MDVPGYRALFGNRDLATTGELENVGVAGNELEGPQIT